MTRRAIPAAALLLAAALIWAGLVASGAGPWSPTPALLVAAQLVVLAAVAVVGMLVAASRWARRLGVAVAAAGLALGVVIPVGGWWWAGVAASGLALAGLVGTAFKGVVRERPAATGPPREAVLLSLLLISAPGILGVVSPDGVGAAALVASLASVGAGAWYLKAAPGALWVVRLLAPLLWLVAAVATGLWGGVVLGVGAAGAAGLAWTAGARLAVKPLTTEGTRVRIPPELAPREVLDAAGLDERGRRRGDRE